MRGIAWRQGLAALLICACLVAQTLGMLHRLQHAGGPAHAPTELARGNTHIADLGTLDRLFGEHHLASDCRLYDHLSAAEIVLGALALPPAMWRSAWLRPVPSLGVSLRATLAFQARGPPLLH
ncbi:hypothetical protein [Delftia acidovorans]|uniref:hypothetical protein n=1 Tax=Delftia acidovorans TaxID=80866 RepID=UPI00054DC62B|nr:hypothetical protein [Delftia acidovorans]